MESTGFTPEEMRAAMARLTKAATNAITLYAELARQSGGGAEAYQPVEANGQTTDINMSSMPECIAALKAYSKVITSRALLSFGGRRSSRRSVGRSPKGHHFRPSALHNNNMLRFLQGFVAQTGDVFNSSKSRLPPILFQTLMCPVNADDMPTHPLGGAGNANLLIALFSVINRLVDVTAYSVLNHEVRQTANGTLENVFNPANPAAGLLPERPAKGANPNAHYIARGFRGLPAALAAPLINEFHRLQEEKLVKLRNNYAVERNPANPKEAANLPVVNALIKQTTNQVTGDVTIETMRVADLFADGKKSNWGRIENGRANPISVPSSNGYVVEWGTVEITVGNIITRVMVPSVSDLNSLVLVDDAGNVILLAATVYPSLSSATTIKDTDLVNEMAKRASYGPYATEFQVYAAAAAQSGMSPGQFYLDQYFRKPDPAYTKFYEDAWAEQQANYDAGKPKDESGKPLKQRGADGKLVKHKDMVFDTNQAWRYVANGLANLSSFDANTRAALQASVNQGQYQLVVNQVSPSLWLIMSFQDVITALAAIRQN